MCMVTKMVPIDYIALSMAVIKYSGHERTSEKRGQISKSVRETSSNRGVFQDPKTIMCYTSEYEDRTLG